MSVTNIINNEELTLVQRVGGLSFVRNLGLRKIGETPIAKIFRIKR